jgi:hypothetical protein
VQQQIRSIRNRVLAVNRDKVITQRYCFTQSPSP